jgi:hypothetical protein
MGIEENNRPATVAIFKGLFTKEALVGTLNPSVAGGTSQERNPLWLQILLTSMR